MFSIPTRGATPTPGTIFFFVFKHLRHPRRTVLFRADFSDCLCVPMSECEAANTRLGH